MKSKMLLFAILSMVLETNTCAQSYPAQQLLLDVQKLAELKAILQDLYKGYQILGTGYATIRDIAHGNFDLNHTFLSSLLSVSPAVKNDQRAQDIIRFQAAIATQCQSAYQAYSQDKHFTPSEISYISTVYGNLTSQSLENLTALVKVLSAGAMRMSDDERLHQIDEICRASLDQWMFLKNFNGSTTTLAVQRATAAGDAGTLKYLYGIR